MSINALSHQFIEGFPDNLEPGVLYVAVGFATMSHLCCCGCGNEVVTPLNPKDWKMTFDGKSVSVDPSIGNWSLACRSHYFIRNGQVLWANAWSDERIHRGRKRDVARKRGREGVTTDEAPVTQRDLEANGLSLWRRALRWLQKR